ncbi:MAG TPA: hypothetical protein VEC39_06755 [Vicinamibacterales bacterium]|nr:hypothetical protein [Vicinamibacterales bacterium]
MATIVKMRMAGRRKLRRLLDALLRPAPPAPDFWPEPQLGI